MEKHLHVELQNILKDYLQSLPIGHPKLGPVMSIQSNLRRATLLAQANWADNNTINKWQIKQVIYFRMKEVNDHTNNLYFIPFVNQIIKNIHHS